jgi:hypothetical protein
MPLEIILPFLYNLSRVGCNWIALTLLSLGFLPQAFSPCLPRSVPTPAATPTIPLWLPPTKTVNAPVTADTSYTALLVMVLVFIFCVPASYWLVARTSPPTTYRCVSLSRPRCARVH